MPLPAGLRSPCIDNSCSIALRHVSCDDRLCIQANLRLYAPVNPQPHGAPDLCNALQCIEASTGNVGGAAVLVRSTNCIQLRCVADRNGLSAIEAAPLLYVPTPQPAAEDPTGLACVPGSNAMICIPHFYDSLGNVQRAGGMAVLVKKSYTVNLRTEEVTLCGFPYKHILADVTLNPCEANAIQSTIEGLSALVGKTDCIELKMEADASTCSTAPTKVIKAYPIVAPDPRNLLTCTTVGLAALVRDTDCIKLSAVEETVAGVTTRWLEATFNVCDSADNAFTCGPGGVGVFFDDTCSIRLDVVAQNIGCGASKAVKAFVKPTPDSGGAYNLISESAGGLGAMVRPSSCIGVKVVQEATSNNDCTGIARIIEFEPIIASDPSNATTCNVSGLATYVSSFYQDSGRTSCVKLGVQNFTVNGVPAKAIIADLVVDPTLPANAQALRCFANGAGVLVNSTGCVNLEVRPNAGGLDAIHANLNFAASKSLSGPNGRVAAANNAVHCRATCAGDAQGLAVTFRDMGDYADDQGNVLFKIVDSPCGGKDIVGKVQLATADGADKCNGLSVAADGSLKAPPDVHSDVMSAVAAADSKTASGTGTTLSFPVGGDELKNESECRRAYAIVWVRTPVATVEILPSAGQSACGSIQYSGTFSSPSSTQTMGAGPVPVHFCVGAMNVGGKPVVHTTPWRYASGGFTQLFLFELGPGEGVSGSVTPNYTKGGSGSVTMSTDQWEIGGLYVSRRVL